MSRRTYYTGGGTGGGAGLTTAQVQAIVDAEPTTDVVHQLQQFTLNGGATAVEQAEVNGYTVARLEDPVTGNWGFYSTTDNLPTNGGLVRIKFLRTPTPQRVVLRGNIATSVVSDLRIDTNTGEITPVVSGAVAAPTVHDVTITDYTIDVTVWFPPEPWESFQIYPASLGAAETGALDVIEFDMNPTPQPRVPIGSPAGTAHRIAQFVPPAPINIASPITINTGFDLTAHPGLTVKMWFTDFEASNRQWPAAEIDVDLLTAAHNAGTAVESFVHIFDNAHVRININDAATGSLIFTDVTRHVMLARAELWVTTQDVANRIDVFNGPAQTSTSSWVPHGAPNPELGTIGDGDVAILTYGDGTRAQGYFLDGIANVAREGGLAQEIQIVAGDQLELRNEAGSGGSGIAAITILKATTIYRADPFQSVVRTITDWDAETTVSGYVQSAVAGGGVIANAPAGFADFCRGRVEVIGNYVVQQVWDRAGIQQYALRTIINGVVQDAGTNNGWKVYQGT